MKKTVYESPTAEIIVFRPSRVICESGPERNIVYGNENEAGGDINDDNYVNGGTF